MCFIILGAFFSVSSNFILFLILNNNIVDLIKLKLNEILRLITNDSLVSK